MRGCLLRHARSTRAKQSPSNFGTEWAAPVQLISELRTYGRGAEIRTPDLLVPNQVTTENQRNSGVAIGYSPALYLI